MHTKRCNLCNPAVVNGAREVVAQLLSKLTLL